MPRQPRRHAPLGRRGWAGGAAAGPGSVSRAAELALRPCGPPAAPGAGAGQSGGRRGEPPGESVLQGFLASLPPVLVLPFMPSRMP